MPLRADPSHVWRQRSLTILVSTLLSLAVVEVAARAIGPECYRFSNRSDEYYTNPRGYHVPIGRNGRHTVYGLHYRTSAEGYRLPDNGEPLGVSSGGTILGLGDSFTYGNGVRYGDLYLTRLERVLRSQIDGTIRVRNCARGGADARRVAAICQHEMPRVSPFLVIYGLVLNDFGLAGQEIIGLDYIDINNGGYQHSLWREFSATVNLASHVYEKMRLDRVTRRAYLEAFSDETALPKFDLLGRMSRGVEAQGAEFVIVLFPMLYDLNERYPFRKIHRKIATFCQRHAIPLLDLLDPFSQHRAEDLWVNPTDHHPNEIAHRIAAEELFRFLRDSRLLPPELLRDRARSQPTRKPA